DAVGLLQSRDINGTGVVGVQPRGDAAVADVAVHELKISAERANLCEDRGRRIRRRIDACPHAGARCVRRERDASVASRRHHELVSAGLHSTRDRDCKATGLEGSGRIGALVFHPQLLEAMTSTKTLGSKKRRTPLAERYRMFSFSEWQPRPVAPHRPALAS